MASGTSKKTELKLVGVARARCEALGKDLGVIGDLEYLEPSA